MNNTDWILLDTETTGLVAPIFVVELAAQRMRGWKSVDQPFRKLLNQNLDIPSEASRVHGYTREILERDGQLPHKVYEAFAAYVGRLPLVAYNLEYDLDEVLKPEWKRLKVRPVGTVGFCALRLAQRLLDPVPAGNCKLQTLRQYYRLPERGAHTALGDVMTVADLFATILQPIAEQRGLDSWNKIVQYADEEWYPSRFAFGKFKGQSFWEARKQSGIQEWLAWLSRSKNPKTARMGRWYLTQLNGGNEREPSPVAMVEAGRRGLIQIVVYVHPDLHRLRELIAAARARLADIEAAYTTEKAKIDSLQAKLFGRLRHHYEARDRLQLIVSYRKTYLDALLRQGEEAASQVEEEFHGADARTKEEYQRTWVTMSDKRQLSGEEEAELQKLWKKLVKLYHPDRFAQEPKKQETYSKLTSVINRAKDNGDLETLREIATDPAGFILRQGWEALDFSDTNEVLQLRRLWESLEAEIVAVLEATNQLRESPEYELYSLTELSAEVFERVVAEQVRVVENEVATLKSQAEQFAAEIAEVSGEGATRIQ